MRRMGVGQVGFHAGNGMEMTEMDVLDIAKGPVPVSHNGVLMPTKP